MTMTLEDVSLLEQMMVFEARESFWAYRRLMNPRMKRGWFAKDLAENLQWFADELIAQRSPKMVIAAPPQHGKSLNAVDLITWIAGRAPDLRTIYTSFSDRLGIRANLRVQRIMSSPKYQRVFPHVRLGKQGATRNRELIEFAGHDGYFRNTTVNGAINGEGLDFGLIDDPLKGRKEANSQRAKDQAWEYFTDDYFTRFSDGAGFLVIATRWALDDPTGHIIEEFRGQVRVLNYQALATKDEPHRKAGTALFPALKSEAFLMERKQVMSSASFEALYQGDPKKVGGAIIHIEWFKYYTVVPQLQYRIIYGDTAQKTKEANDYAVFACWGLGVDGKIYLLDLIRDKWEAPELTKRSVAFWNKHLAYDELTFGALRLMKVEDKVSGTGLIQTIKKEGRIPIVGIERSLDKLTRVMDGVGYIESGYVVLPEDAPFLSDFLDECEDFRADMGHDHDDQIDPMMDAIKDMLGSPLSMFDVL